MTGFGEYRSQIGECSIFVEIRAVNHRHLKTVLKISDSHARYEPEIESLLRGAIHRGAVTVHVRVDRPRQLEDYKLNLTAIASYRNQLQTLEPGGRIEISALLMLPGVVEEGEVEESSRELDWADLERAVRAALQRFNESRAVEGRAMAAELANLGKAASQQLGRVAARAPQVVKEYQERLLERVAQLLCDQPGTLEPKDVAREVALLADRADVAEELVRFRAHLDHYHTLLSQAGGSGRKLEFLVQEMGREINTIGAKANDVEIARAVVEVKAILEKIRELVQNVE